MIGTSRFSRRELVRKLRRAAAGSSLLSLLPSRAQSPQGSTGIYGMTRKAATLRIPADNPPGAHWRYGIGLPFQVSEGLAGVACNIRVGFHDLEGGNDVV